MALRTVGVRLMAEVSEYKRNLQDAGRTTKGFAGELDKAAKAGKLDAVANSAAVVGVGMLGMAGYAVKAAADFDKSMSAVKAATHAGAAEIGLLREAALQAGKDTQYSATEAADGITELSKAGVSTADVLGGGLKGALSLAAAGQLDVAEAAETAASALTQFGLKGSDVPHVADLLAAAAGKAQGSVHDMGYALNQAGLVANQAGLSIEDTTGALAEFANAGLIGSDAGTSFKTMLLAMEAPSGVTAKKMQELGISFYDAQGKFIGLGGVAAELHDKLGDLTEEERNAALGQIYGNDAIRAAAILYKDGAKGVEEWRNKVDDAGYAATTAAALTDNLAGDVERLKGSLETMAIEAGGGANGGLRTLAQAANALVDQLGELPSGVTGTLTVLTGLSGVLLLGAAGWVKMRRSTAEALEQLRDAGPVGVKAASGLQATAKWAGRAAAAFVAVEVAATAINAAIGTDLNPQIDALGTGLESLATSGKVGGEAARLLGGDLGKLDTAMKDVADTGRWSSFARGFAGSIESFTGTGHTFDDSLTNSKERLQAVDQALQQLVQGGHADQAAEVFKTLADRAADQGVSVNELKGVLPGYSAALETAGTASSNTAADVTELAGAADSASGKVIALSKSIDDLFQSQMSADRAALKLAESTNDLVAELNKGSRTLNINSEEGRKNRAAVLDQLEAIEALRDAHVRGNGKLDEANAKYQRDIEGLKASMRQAGFSKAAIDELVGAYEKIPASVSTTVGVDGATTARRDVKDLKYEITTLKGKTIYVTVHYSATGSERLDDSGHRIGGAATGGPIVGPGPKGVDSELRLLAPGEHVWTAAEVDAVGGQAAMARMRAAALSGSPMTGGTTQVMPASAGAQRVIVETRSVVEFAGGADAFGQLMLNALRVRPGLRKTMATQLAAG